MVWLNGMISPVLVSFVTAMEKHLQATQRFLKGLASLPTFAEVKARQLKHLRGVIEKAASQGTAAVADLVASLDPTIWNPEELETLKHALADKVSDGKERRKMQDFTAFPRYLPEHVWNRLLTSSNQKDRLESLVKFCISLGMRCPSEPTIGGLVWLSTCALRTQEISESEKVLALKESKPNIRRWLANLASPAVYLQVLPTNVADCPAELMQVAFPQGFESYTPPGFQLAHYEEVVRRFPLRRREGEDGKGGAAGMSGEYTHILGKLFAGAVEGVLARSGSVSSAGGSSLAESQSNRLPLQDGTSPAPSAEPALRAGQSVPAGPSLSAGQGSMPLLALEDAPRVDGQFCAALSGASEAPTVESQLKCLQDALHAPPAEGADLPDDIKKRPASKQKVSKKNAATGPSGSAGAKKRPAAREEAARGAVGSAGSKKRPGACEASMASLPHANAASAAGSVRSKQKLASKAKAKPKSTRAKAGQKAKRVQGKDAYRKRLLASVPSALKKSFAQGCSTCRYRPFCCNSCWFKRGFRV